jgi:hypothetical protein
MSSKGGKRRSRLEERRRRNFNKLYRHPCIASEEG